MIRIPHKKNTAQNGSIINNVTKLFIYMIKALILMENIIQKSVTSRYKTMATTNNRMVVIHLISGTVQIMNQQGKNQ